jgi:N-acetylmuramic acid 6-phosphate etherase
LFHDGAGVARRMRAQLPSVLPGCSIAPRVAPEMAALQFARAAQPAHAALVRDDSATEVAITERANPATRGLDTLETRALVATLLRENAAALAAVERCADDVAIAVDGIVARIEAGGRLHYVGAGTSGRLGVLDAAECPPTFGVPTDLVVAHIAGGEPALRGAVEGAEDDALAGEREAQTIDGRDAVVAISASGSAPFVVAAATSARSRGALTVALTSVRGGALERACERAIIVEVGAEPIAGSTRMKAGTAQKLVLNALSTAAMVRLGKVYDNLMVDVVASNDKLRRRAIRLVCAIAAVDAEQARTLLAAANGSVKVATVMRRCSVGAAAARTMLERAGGRLREVLEA